MVLRAQIPAPAFKNNLERSYAGLLELRKRAGEVALWEYEKVGFKLANGCFFYPDFMVVLANGEVQFHETKGFMREDAAVKLKVFAEMFPFTLILVRKEGKTFKSTRISQ